MKLNYFFTLCFFLIKLNLSAQNFEWAKSMGGTGFDYNYSGTVDAAGNVYTTGTFSGTADFNPGPGVNNLVSVSSTDVFISKIDALGNFVWAKRIGGIGNDSGNSIRLDASGNVYVFGNYSSTVDFNPNAGVFNMTPVQSADVFVLKLDASGNFIWARSIGGTGVDNAYAMSIDNSGNLYLAGRFSGTADFDPGSGTFNLTSGSATFITKLNSLGNFVWAKSLESPLGSIPNGIANDNLGNVYVGGGYSGTIDLDPGPGVVSASSNGNNDIFIVKLNSAGNYSWSQSFGDIGNDAIYDVYFDQSGNILTTGSFQTTIDFDQGPGVSNQTSNGSIDVFIYKFDDAGNHIWSKSFGATGTDRGQVITSDIYDNVYITGYFQGTVDFDPGSGVNNLNGFGNDDIFIAKFTNNGDFAWATSIGAANDDSGRSIEVLPSGDVYTMGYYQNTADFEQGAGVTNLTSNGGADQFVLKYSQCFSPVNFVDVINTCSSYSWRDGNVYSSNNNSATYTVPGVAAGGCDSVYTLNLTINNSSNGTDVVSECDTYTWIDGNTYTSSNNTATHTLTNVAGCDSVVTLNLTITNSNTGIDVQTACDSYTWIDGNTYSASNNTATHTLTNLAGCDSVVTLNLTITNSNIGTAVVAACDSYTWIDGNTYTSSNSIATHTLTNMSGCDSVVTLNLTITNSNTGIDVQTACDSYTWIDGNTYSASNNTATHTLTNLAGCDSVVTLNLTITNSNTGTAVVSACDTYTWIDGNTYTSSNSSATHTLTNIAGCDSTVTLNLTITNSNAGTAVATACDSYTWIDGNTYTSSNSSATHTLTNIAGCDSVVTLNLTITNSTTGTAVVTACDTYTWIDGNTYNASNNAATHTLTNVAGCDSLVTLNLTINSSYNQSENISICNSDSYTLPNGTVVNSNGTFYSNLTSISGCDSIIETVLNVIAPNITTSLSGITITANAFGSTNQWLDCNNAYQLIVGETGASFTPTSNGSYAVSVNENGCTDTSACVTISDVGIETNSAMQFTIYPNPAQTQIFVSGNFPIDHLTLLDLSGRIVKTNYNVNTIYVGDLQRGTYVLEIFANDKKTLHRIIIQ